MMPHEQRAIHAAHDAGGHDSPTGRYPGKGPNPKCKICIREQEQEATEMAKQTTPCICGGTYDGTPSGKAKHEATGKHQAAVAEMASHGATPEEIADEGTVENFDPAEVASVVAPSMGASEMISGMTTIIDETSRELDRRRTDHKWREANKSASEASAYQDEKVTPLVWRKAILEQAVRALREAAAKDL